MSWEDEFRQRIKKFEAAFSKKRDGVSLSIKVRVTGGCFHRSCSHNAYRIIDDYLRTNQSPEIFFEEHESGPELLVYLSLATVGVGFTVSVINLATAIIKARSEGVKHGDRPNEPLELIVRGFDEDGKLREERILRIDSWHDVNRKVIEQALQNSARKMIPTKKGKKRKKSDM